MCRLPAEVTPTDKHYPTAEETENPFDSLVSEPATDTLPRVRNSEMNIAWQFVADTDVSVFLTGKAGTGKTTFLKRLRELSPKRMVVLAPTGVAAINAQGQTIHSFFQLPFGPIVPGMETDRRKSYRMSEEKKELIRSLDLLVIDEISMVRCDLLDAIDRELRKYRDRYKPFGGVQLLLIGDLQQLAPVAKEHEWRLLSETYETPYFFSSLALQQIPFVTIELKYIYRQRDAEFIGILEKIRSNSVDSSALAKLNSRYIPNFVSSSPGDDWIRLTTHNRVADDYNERMLAGLPGDAHHFEARIRGTFPESSYPAEKDLVLKVGAQVMFLKNDPTAAHAYYNGKIGIVRAITEKGISVWSKEDDREIIVPQLDWENARYVIDNETGEIKEEIEGVFKQYPLRLAWAITIHKSQGLTFDHAVLDVNDSFAHGQTYVALSRCRTLEGMVLTRPLNPSAIITDRSVNRFIDAALAGGRETEQHIAQMKNDYCLKLLDELFSFDTLLADLRYLRRVVDEHLFKKHKTFADILKEAVESTENDVEEVARRFAPQYRRLLALMPQPAKNEALQLRLKASYGYFLDKLIETMRPVIKNCKLRIDNKRVAKVYGNALQAFIASYKIKTGILRRLPEETFTPRAYLNCKAQSALDNVALS